MDTATATTPATALLTWVRNSETGDYRSSCGRFRIWNNKIYSRHGKWSVIDTAVKDSIVANGQYNRSAQKYTLASCKSQAQRWANGKNF